MSEMSQATIVGLPQPKTWDELERGCLATFSGGYCGTEANAFQHGMTTVFNLLRAEFPPAELCKACPDLLAACEAAIADGPHNASHGLSSAVVDMLRAAVAKTKGTDQ